jgi:hypothetical protein
VVSRRTARRLLLALLLAHTGACRSSPPGDSGGAATGDRLDSEGIGSARSNDSFERARPSDTIPPTEVHDERGADTSSAGR